jgi:hypothetical protein
MQILIEKNIYILLDLEWYKIYKFLEYSFNEIFVFISNN